MSIWIFIEQEEVTQLMRLDNFICLQVKVVVLYAITNYRYKDSQVNQTQPARVQRIEPGPKTLSAYN